MGSRFVFLGAGACGGGRAGACCFCAPACALSGWVAWGLRSCFAVVCLVCRFRLACGFLGCARRVGVLGFVVGACAGVLPVVFGLCCRWRWLPALCGRCLVLLLVPGRWPASCLCGLSFLLFAFVCCWRSLVLGALLVAVVVARGCCGLGLVWCVWVGVPGSAVVLFVSAAVACLAGWGWRACLLVLLSWFCLFVRCVVAAAWGVFGAFFCSVRFGFVAPPALEVACRLVLAVGGVITL
jgi:hypothetical protein